MATLVRASDRCLSACALAFLGGTLRSTAQRYLANRTIEVGGQVGFHNFSLDPEAINREIRADPTAGLNYAATTALVGAATVLRYINAIKVSSPKLLADLLARPIDQWEYIDTSARFINARACPMPQVPPPTVGLDRQAANVCMNALGIAASAGDLTVESLTARNLRRRALTILLHEIEENRSKSQLAAQLRAMLDQSRDGLIDTVYAELSATGLPLPVPRGSNFEISGEALSMGGERCLVSLTTNDLNQYSVAVFGTAGLQTARRFPPADCPTLFRHEADSVINPAR